MDPWTAAAVTMSNLGSFLLGALCLKWAIERGYAVIHRKHPQHRRRYTCDGSRPS
jgi:hypothetical protein